MKNISAAADACTIGARTMKITSNLIKQVVADVAGEDVIPLVIAIRDKKNISEFKIAELINEQINITRNKLYRLFDSNLISFVRKKDRKKGWYIYYWTFNEKQVKFLAVKLKRERMERLKDRLTRETGGQFYLCPNKCIRLDFEQSTNFDFKCPECGSLIEQENNAKEIERIKSQINELDKSLHEDLKEMGLLPRREIGAKKISVPKKTVSAKKAKPKAKKTVKKAVKKILKKVIKKKTVKKKKK